MTYSYHMSRRVGRYTKYETAELRRMCSEGYSVYKICRNLNRSQKSIRNNLIRLGLMEGEISPRRYTTKSNDVLVDDSAYLRHLRVFSRIFPRVITYTSH